MDVGAGAFLFGSVGGLEDEDGLGGEEDAGGVKELGQWYVSEGSNGWEESVYRMCGEE